MSTKTQKPGSFQVVRAVARVTAMEVLRDKILYNTVLFAVLLLGAGYLAARLSFANPGRIVLDFGLSAVNLSCSAIAVFAGAMLLGREFERRTIFIALAHPISRIQFVVGKYFGMVAVLFLNWVLLSACYLFILNVSGGFQGISMTTLLTGIFLVWLQSLVLAAFAILFSTFSTTSLSAVMTVGIYLIGNNISQIRIMAERSKNQAASGSLDLLTVVLPNLEHFNLGNKITYGLPVEPQFVAVAILYSFALILVAMLLAGSFIRNKEN